MKVLITGAAGQVGAALLATAPAGIVTIGLDRAALDIGDRAAIAQAISAHAPALVINTAAYTAVDKAESEAELAQRINGDGPGLLALAAREASARFVHISTDFVFDGSASSPYLPDAPMNPLSVYGTTKAHGEAAVRAAMPGALPGALILRTSWVYANGGRNFVETMLRLFAGDKPVRVVADQVGTPTHAVSLARSIWALAAAGATGTHHMTDAGTASWYDFAVAIQDIALEAGVIAHRVPIIPITTADYPTPARRPAYSVLDKASTWAITLEQPVHWRHELASMIATRQRGPHG